MTQFCRETLQQDAEANWQQCRRWQRCHDREGTVESIFAAEDSSKNNLLCSNLLSIFHLCLFSGVFGGAGGDGYDDDEDDYEDEELEDDDEEDRNVGPAKKKQRIATPAAATASGGNKTKKCRYSASARQCGGCYQQPCRCP